eukprot:scpid62956/ scgid16959/ 
MHDKTGQAIYQTGQDNGTKTTTINQRGAQPHVTIMTSTQRKLVHVPRCSLQPSTSECVSVAPVSACVWMRACMCIRVYTPSCDGIIATSGHGHGVRRERERE